MNRHALALSLGSLLTIGCAEAHHEPAAQPRQVQAGMAQASFTLDRVP